ncbi:MAG: endonuclease/exonuclease/phosphatase family protein, partial [Candidatus Binatia bacterium]
HDYPLLRHVEARFRLLVDALAAETPDVAFLQEISISEAHGHLPNRLVAALRDRRLDYEIAYAPANGSVADGGNFEEGSAILSRHPLTGCGVRRLAADRPVIRELHGYRFVEHRIALRATIQAPDGGPLDVFGIHLTDAPPVDGRAPRREQIEDFERFVAERPSRARPAIVAGDFNASPEAEEIRWLASRGLEDLGASHAAATNDRNDRDLEARADTSDHRIDYVFGLAAGETTVAPREARSFLAAAAPTETGGWLWASDHNGVVVDLEIV